MPHVKLVKLLCIILTFVTIFGAGAAAAWLHMHATAPASLLPAVTAKMAPVHEQSYSDERSVSVEFTVAPGVKLSTPVEGRVTSTECLPGAIFTSGQQIMSVNERSVIVLYSTVPFWRDIELNTHGEDITALQTELVRLGFNLSVTGAVGPDTLRALMQLTFEPAEDGLPVPIPLSQLVWIPSQSISISECGLRTGERIGVDAEIAVLSDLLTAVRVKNMPADLLPGDRIIEIDSVVAAVDTAGVMSDLAALSAVSASPTYLASRAANTAAAESEQGLQEPKVSLRLQNPLQVGSVPPSAIFQLDDPYGCVSDGTTGIPVQILGSELGQTFVHFMGEVFPESVELVPANTTACR